MEKKYRKNVGLMIVNEAGLVWMGERANVLDSCYKYQMPQGGIDSGELPIEAAYRELFEETGLKNNQVELIRESNCWYKYDFKSPLTYHNVIYYGQEQKWFLFRFKGCEKDFNLNTYPEEIEFSSFIWVGIDEIANLIIPFKKDVYQKVVEEFKPFL